MIFDRTQTDVDNAKMLRSGKVQNFIELTSGEIETLERGTLTINAINRIEDKQSELKGIINDIGYWNTPILNKSWGYSNIFYTEEFQRILSNADTLRDAFFVYTDTPNTPIVSYKYDTLNNIEKILVDIENIITNMTSRFRECNTFECGEVNTN